MKTRTLALASMVAALALLGGCAVTPYEEPYYVESVRVAPPPPYVEYVGPPPVVGHVWISGYWNWGGARYVWVPGRWEAPRSGYHWVPHRWDRDGETWRRHGGRWEWDGHRAPPQGRFRDPPTIDRHVVPSPRPMPNYVAPPERPDNRRWRGDGPDERHFGRGPDRGGGTPGPERRDNPPRLEPPRQLTPVPDRPDSQRGPPPATERPRPPKSDDQGWGRERREQGWERRGRDEGR